MLKDYYTRQNALVGPDHASRIRDAYIPIFGIGGSGAAVAECLVRLGIGRLLLVDPDVVEISNLNRQILFTIEDVGKSKVMAAADRLRIENPNVCILTRETIGVDDIESLIGDADLVVDCCDEHLFKVALSRKVSKAGKPLIHTSAFGFRGCVTTFKDELTYEEFFGLPSAGKPIEALTASDVARYREFVVCKVSRGMYPDHLAIMIAKGEIPWQTLVPTPIVASGLVAMEVLRLLTGDFGNPIIAPLILRFDLLRNECTIERE